MTSLVEIYNRALGQVAARSTVASVSEGTTEARNCNLYYPGVRDQVLRAANWDFATKTATLALLKAAPGTPENTDIPDTSIWTSAQPAPPWLYEYTYPSDCLRVQRLIPQFNTMQGLSPPLFPTTLGSFTSYTQDPWGRFDVANDQDENGNDFKCILTNISQALGAYTRQVTETSVWPEDFIEAVVFALAGRLATALSGDKRQVQIMFGLADKIITDARRDDANEGLTIQDHVPDWMAVRGVNWLPGTPGFWTAPYGPLFSMSL